MENKLKEVSSDILKVMNDCGVRTVMATGDNVLTAISVARQCKMLDPSKQVYLGELSTSGDKPRVKWTLTGAYTPGSLSNSIHEEKMTL